MSEPMKYCPRCKKEKSLTEFNKDKYTKSGLACYCKSCAVAKNRNYYGLTKDKIIDYNLRRKFDITLEQYDQMFEKQNGICAVCNKINTDGRRLCVDHCHRTRKIRGLLCHNCNFIIGHAKDNIQILKKVIEYLKGN